jgi:molybdopterin synthase catalytic subunit
MPGSTDAGAGRAALAGIRDSEITVEECVAAVAGPEHGAIVTFAGVVRNHDERRHVERLSYSAHPSAEAELTRVAEELATAHPETRIAVLHRVGDLAIGDVALACAVSSAHRAAAFAVCALLVDEVKSRVPIWKEQFFADGTAEWVAALG